jgi:hypothetical protein
MIKSNQPYYKRFLTHVDLFGVKPKFNIQKRQKYTSPFGGLVSLLFIVLITMGIIYFTKELFTKTTPSVLLQNSEYNTYPRRLNLTHDKYSLFFGVQDPTGINYIDESIYIPIVYLSVITVTNDTGTPVVNFDTQNLRAERCSLDRHFSSFIELFKDQDLSAQYCIHPDDMDSIYLEGSWGNDKFISLTLDIEVCVNSTQHTCKPQEVIDEQLSGGYFAFNWVDNIFDPKDYNNPNRNIRRDYFTTLSKNFFKYIVTHINNIDYITDSGFLMESNNEKHYFQYEHVSEMMDFRNQKLIFKNEIRLSNLKTIFTRRYLKVQDLVAQIGGLIKGIMLFIQILLTAYTKTNFYTYLTNELYNLDNNCQGSSVNQSPKESGGNKESQQKIIDPTKPITFSNTNIIMKKRNQNSPTAVPKRKLILTFIEKIEVVFVKIFSCCKSSKKNIQMFELGESRLKDNMDIIKYNKLCHSFEVIKLILLDDHGQVLFKHLIANNIDIYESIPIQDTSATQDVNQCIRLMDKSYINKKLNVLYEKHMTRLNK